jgi:hypothetical protein
MACEFCGEEDKSRLGMRSSVVNGKANTVEICSSCLGKKLILSENENGKLLSKEKQFGRKQFKNK